MCWIHCIIVLVLVSTLACEEFRLAWLAPNDTTSGASAPGTVGALVLALEHIENHGILPDDSFV